MGPHEKPRQASSDGRQHSINSDEDEMARWANEGWQVGFGVEMQGVGAVLGAGQRDAESDGETEADDRTESDEDIRLSGSEDNVSDGYRPLPSSDANQSQADARWLPPNGTSTLPPPPPLEEMRIQHQPIDIELDQAKVNEIKSIMANFSGPVQSQQPEWMRQIDDRKLTELVKHLKGGDC